MYNTRNIGALRIFKKGVLKGVLIIYTNTLYQEKTLSTYSKAHSRSPRTEIS